MAQGGLRDETALSAQLRNLTLGSAPASEIDEVGNRLASVERKIEEVAESVKLMSRKSDDITAKFEMTIKELAETVESSEKYKNLSVILTSRANEKAMLMDEKAKLMDEKAKLMDKEESTRSLVQRSTRSTQPQPEAPRQVMTPPEQSNASSFAGTVFAKGFGFLPSSFHFDPTFQLRVWSRLVPDAKDVEDLVASAAAAGRPKSLLVLGELGNMLHQGEDSTDGVRAMLDSSLSIPQLSSSGSKLNACGGIVSTASKPDFLWTLHGSPLGVLEVKGGSSSVLSALRQAAVTATNIAVSLLQRGCSAEDIVVPVAGSTGRVMQFGAVVVLQPSFPTFLPTSHILDLACDGSNALANAYLIKASKWVQNFGQNLRTNSEVAERVAMTLSVSKYHIKKLDEVTLKRGLGLFSTPTNPSVLEVGPGLAHMGRVLNKLFAHPSSRAIAVFPLSVRSPNEDWDTAVLGTRSYWLVYDDLVSSGFKIGTPDRLQDSKLYERFLQALRRGISHIHEAGVIHCDLYPSNIMWKEAVAAAEGEGEEQGVEIEIRIIDWDNAHCLDEKDFGKKCRAALMDHKPTRSAEFGVNHDWKYYGVLASAIKPGEEGLWTDLASNSKKNIDEAFYALFPSF